MTQVCMVVLAYTIITVANILILIRASIRETGERWCSVRGRYIASQTSPTYMQHLEITPALTRYYESPYLKRWKKLPVFSSCHQNVNRSCRPGMSIQTMMLHEVSRIPPGQKKSIYLAVRRSTRVPSWLTTFSSHSHLVHWRYS